MSRVWVGVMAGRAGSHMHEQLLKINEGKVNQVENVKGDRRDRKSAKVPSGVKSSQIKEMTAAASGERHVVCCSNNPQPSKPEYSPAFSEK